MKFAAVGSNCIDYYENLNGGTAFPGGGPVNMAVYAARLGAQSAYVGPVGSDPFGDLLRRAVAEKGVDVSRLRQKPGKTAVTQVLLEDGDRVLGDYDEGVLADYRLSPEDLDFLQGFDVVVCDLWGKVGGQFRELQARGVPTAFDGADRPEDPACQEALPYTDYLFFSAREDTPALRRQMQGYAAGGPKLVTATLGERGSLCWDGERFHSFGVAPCPQVVDTLGAGDSYIAGFLVAYARAAHRGGHGGRRPERLGNAGLFRGMVTGLEKGARKMAYQGTALWREPEGPCLRNFNERKAVDSVNGALALRPQIERIVDQLWEEGFDGIWYMASGAPGPRRCRRRCTCGARPPCLCTRKTPPSSSPQGTGGLPAGRCWCTPRSPGTPRRWWSWWTR